MADAIDFERDVVAASGAQAVIVDFFAAWCQPCTMLAPVLQQAEAASGGAVRLVKIDTDARRDLAQRFGVSGIPDVRLWRGGLEVDRFVGFKPLQQVQAWLAPHLPSPGDPDLARAESALSAGDAAAALDAARAAQRADPRSARAAAALVRAAAMAGDGALAQSTFAALRELPGGGAQRDRLTPLVELIEALAQPAETDPLDEPFRAALRDALAGRYREALVALLALVRRDKRWRDAACRKAMVAIFRLAGERSPLSEEFRAQLAAALY